MRRVVIFLAVGVGWVTGLSSQQSAPAPQTARQALIEMFFSKTPGTFARHLPAITRAAIDKFEAAANLQQFSMMATQLQTQGQSFETFESGPVLLRADNAKTG